MTGTYDAYAAGREEPRFTDWLRERAGPGWTDAVEHRFVEGIGDDTVGDDAFRRYLVQDYAFVGTLVGVVGHAVGEAPTMEAKSELSSFLATLTDDEDDYFERSFDALSVPAADRREPDLDPVTAAFEDLLLRGARSGDYEETLAVLLPAEWIYLAWATRVEDSPTDRFYLREWIDLHANPEFEAFVGWLRSELDAYGPDLAGRRQRRVARLFERVVAYEVDFFDMACDRRGRS